MNPRALSAQDRLRALKSDFDQSFTASGREDGRELEGFLKVRVAGDAYALRLNDVAAISARPKIVPLPSRCPEFLGMAGHRGTLAALFSLQRLLGYGGAEAAPRWFALVRGPDLLGLAFEAYEGFAWVPVSDIHPVGEAARRPFAARAVTQVDSTRLIVDLPAMMAGLSQEQREN